MPKTLQAGPLCVPGMQAGRRAWRGVAWHGGRHTFWQTVLKSAYKCEVHLGNIYYAQRVNIEMTVLILLTGLNILLTG